MPPWHLLVLTFTIPYVFTLGAVGGRLTWVTETRLCPAAIALLAPYIAHTLRFAPGASPGLQKLVTNVPPVSMWPAT